ncbi:NB-ARC and TPR repeat-containing protein [Methylorubrum populi]|uniref:NB-ARC and TPR repeat-containing protein n=1 Tax=Methylorubrum populi TaxID=223967 RepID=A0A160PIV3_9HYPH|nr:hypothetical protein [Methylorubrum populi]BAU93409.1 NB-ARC and TPR repeat-containing protein [Methylorubrum populi]
MADKALMEVGRRLSEHLARHGVRQPVVGAGSRGLFVYALNSDRRAIERLGGLPEFEGTPVQYSFGGRFKAQAA